MQKGKKILSMIGVTADEHIHDSKALPELVNDIIKSDSMTTTIGKLFADEGCLREVMIFLGTLQTMESCLRLR